MPNLGFLSLVPALVTISVALVRRKVTLALFCGVVAGALVFGGLHPIPVMKALAFYFLAVFRDGERLKIILFILLVGGLLEVMAVSGAYRAFAESLGKVLHSARRTRLAAWFLSLCLFFDDYANVLITGSSMRVIARKNGVRPAMLAYFVDVVAVLASVMLVSTWAAFEGSTMAEAARATGVERGATALLLASLPFHFYTYLAIFLTFLVAVSGRWFGTRLDTHRFLAYEESAIQGRGASLQHVVAPLLTLVLGALVGLFLAGGFVLWRRGEPLSLLRMLWAAPTVDVLVGSTLLALALAIFLFRKDGVLSHRVMRPAFGRGVRDMLEIGVIVLLATGLSRASADLGTGAYLAAGITRSLRPEWIPFAIFALAMLVTVSTGFSWGAMAIIMPVAYSLTRDERLIPVLSAAVVTGAVSGEHLIPFSEKAVLSATACGIPPVYHFKTHVLQSLAAFSAAGLGFLALGFGWPLWSAYGMAVVLLTAAHLVFAT